MPTRKPRAKSSTAHIRMGDEQGDLKTLRCENCGDVMRYILPMPIDVWVAMARAYEKAHRGCKPRILQTAPASIHAVESSNG